jgi:hypothetical protein
MHTIVSYILLLHRLLHSSITPDEGHVKRSYSLNLLIDPRKDLTQKHGKRTSRSPVLHYSTLLLSGMYVIAGICRGRNVLQ